MTIRFHLDEHIHPAIAAGLTSHGIDVTTTAEAGLLHATDEQHLAWALAEHRVIVTHDDDFLVRHAEGCNHAGIAYCHQGKHSIGELLQMLLLLHACFDADDMNQHVEFL